MKHQLPNFIFMIKSHHNNFDKLPTHKIIFIDKRENDWMSYYKMVLNITWKLFNLFIWSHQISIELINSSKMKFTNHYNLLIFSSSNKSTFNQLKYKRNNFTVLETRTCAVKGWFKALEHALFNSKLDGDKVKNYSKK